MDFYRQSILFCCLDYLLSPVFCFCLFFCFGFLLCCFVKQIFFLDCLVYFPIANLFLFLKALDHTWLYSGVTPNYALRNPGELKGNIWDVGVDYIHRKKPYLLCCTISLASPLENLIHHFLSCIFSLKDKVNTEQEKLKKM